MLANMALPGKPINTYKKNIGFPSQIYVDQHGMEAYTKNIGFPGQIYVGQHGSAREANKHIYKKY